MRNLREILRLSYSTGLSIRKISASTKISVGSIQHCDIWDQQYSRQQAICAFDLWKKSIPTSVSKYFEGMIATIGNWHIEAFNYFDYRVTNAYTESANNHIKSIAKQGRGYSFDVLRARVLFVGAKHKIRPKPFKSGIMKKITGNSDLDDDFFNYGVEFPHEAKNS